MWKRVKSPEIWASDVIVSISKLTMPVGVRYRTAQIIQLRKLQAVRFQPVPLKTYSLKLSTTVIETMIIKEELLRAYEIRF